MKLYLQLFFALILFPFLVQAQAVNTPQLGKSTVKEVIAAMTLQEKAQLVVGATELKKASSTENGTTIGFTEQRVPGAAGIMAAIPRLGIPALIVSDGPAGVRINPIRKADRSRTYYATAFPVGTSLASTWDTKLVEEVGRAFGNEVKEYGIDILLAPGMNIHRNPLNGRNFEYYSEDPLISGKMAGAIVRGIQSNGVGTSVKHFSGNNQEANRNGVDVIISERALREIYLRGFKIAIEESDPWTVMSSYNKLNGVFTAESRSLLTTILRDEWKFKGFVMSDWGGGRDRPAMIRAGNDLIMPGRPGQSDMIVAAVNNGTLDVRSLDESVERILNIILKSPTFNKYAYSDKPDLRTHADVVRRAAAEAIVLLKNENKVLPFSNKTKSIAVFGNTSFKTIAGGWGSGDVNKAYVISVIKGISNAGYTVDNDLKKDYLHYFTRDSAVQMAAGAKWPKAALEMVVPDSTIEEKARTCDIAVLTIGRNSGETSDRDLEKNYHLLPVETELIRKVAEAFHKRNKKLIIVLNVAGVVDMKGWKDNADAILLAWQPGQEAGNSIADVLSGNVNPSGKLATTFPLNYSDVSSSKNFPGTPVEKPLSVIYQEGIYVGYRYHDTFKVPVNYEFGYGLSYTNFAVTSYSISKPSADGSFEINCRIKNTGKLAGKQVVQIYIAAPTSSLDKPAQELKAFGKTVLLSPGQSQQMRFTVRGQDLASFYSDKSAWVTDAGRYEVKIGFSSRDIQNTASFVLKNSVVVGKVNKVIAPVLPLNEFKP
ncbi:glycoside hydrolase family 3 C-terminal domain-containing protein [Desertivirga arenae]|uniref:glycoside hydrolase family 3 C-terminal domain-containing protein n=1 Tax=Desertivirga arenae TaxID=2810309 RepID=UPI001A971508|nr:glycoside hydrolase family 3 C-terminal domain-containing protein [Pedobacter sp. SYSU D00823]